jgi:hypothetical protein
MRALALRQRKSSCSIKGLLAEVENIEDLPDCFEECNVFIYQLLTHVDMEK